MSGKNVGFRVVSVVFFKQKTAYEMRISDWSSDVCSSDLYNGQRPMMMAVTAAGVVLALLIAILITVLTITRPITRITGTMRKLADGDLETAVDGAERSDEIGAMRSEEHTSELQSLMRISYAVFCLKKKKHE